MKAALRMPRLALFALLASAAAACAPHGPPQVTAADAQRSNIEIAELQQGRKLLLGKCAGCHRTPMPSEHTATEWPMKLAEMADRAKLDFSQRALIEKYLVTMSER